MASEIRVTNIKANDGTASLTVADSTGNVSVGGTLATTGNTTVGGTLTSTGAITASGGITNAGTISAGTIGTSVTFPTRSDFGIIEIFEAGSPLINHNASQDFSYTSGQPYFVMCNLNGGGTTSYWEYYNITTSNTVSELKSWTSIIAPSIPSSGTLRISVSNVSDRDVWAVILVRMNH